ncbi:hypothetical protein [Cerasicoccus arenae]|uniref:Uncharacterized protein n=1 Tax=Cerasicoccus arenae TaxID=424488 RepID=A0A8J3GCM0_9BACT|nr:hypothetical protein [Cerasicoccus arenae]MBK1858272.1 hypothetical protein [Cerasicoccus arenae]GHB90441.1 hypothetical protein GCM10007047_01480 [Cerasicoccus arenae]
MIKKHPYLFVLLACALMLIAGVTIWIVSDEEPLDYSSMNVEIGPEDAAINGYTKLREVTEGMEWEMGRLEADDWDEWVDINPFYPYEKPLTVDEIQVMLATNQANMDAISDALSMELFLFDQEPTYERFIPESKHILSYIEMRALQARIVAIDGNPAGALNSLLETALNVKQFQKAKGGVVNLVIATAAHKIVNNEIAYLVSHYSLPDLVLQEVLARYPRNEDSQTSLTYALQCEFQFCLSVLTAIEGDADNLDYAIGTSNEYPRPLRMLAYKPNTTRNSFYRLYELLIAQSTLPIEQHDYSFFDNLEHKDLFKMLRSGNFVGESMHHILIPAIQTLTNLLAKLDFLSECTYLYLVIRLYQLEHGTLPPTLDALVPAYIDAVPLDPFDGKPIRYNPARAIIYSVGNDFIDAGGSSYPSRFDHNAADFIDRYDSNEIAEWDNTEPTFHIRFDVEPAAASPSE